jgi:hypothetical protein
MDWEGLLTVCEVFKISIGILISKVFKNPINWR